MKEVAIAVLMVIVIVCTILFARWAYVDVTRAQVARLFHEKSAVEGPVEGQSVSADTPPSP